MLIDVPHMMPPIALFPKNERSDLSFCFHVFQHISWGKNKNTSWYGRVLCLALSSVIAVPIQLQILIDSKLWIPPFPTSLCDEALVLLIDGFSELNPTQPTNAVIGPVVDVCVCALLFLHHPPAPALLYRVRKALSFSLWGSCSHSRGKQEPASLSFTRIRGWYGFLSSDSLSRFVPIHAGTLSPLSRVESYHLLLERAFFHVRFSFSWLFFWEKNLQ